MDTQNKKSCFLPEQSCSFLFICDAPIMLEHPLLFVSLKSGIWTECTGCGKSACANKQQTEVQLSCFALYVWLSFSKLLFRYSTLHNRSAKLKPEPSPKLPFFWFHEGHNLKTKIPRLKKTSLYYFITWWKRIVGHSVIFFTYKSYIWLTCFALFWNHKICVKSDTKVCL